jgi:hypothetical protein
MTFKSAGRSTAKKSKLKRSKNVDAEGTGKHRSSRAKSLWLFDRLALEGV